MKNAKGTRYAYLVRVPGTISFLLGVFGLSVLIFGCTRDTYLTTADGVRIAYEFHQAKSEKGTALLLHGLGSDLSEWAELEPFLLKNGWSTFALDFRGHGLSTEWGKETLDSRNFTDKGRQTMLRDIEAAYQFLPRKHPVWIIGSSIGANLGIQFAARHPEIDGAILLSPGYNYGGIETQPALSRYGERPIFLAGSAEDGSAEFCGTLAQMARGPKKLLTYKEAGHGSMMILNVKNLKQEILEWMNQNTR